MALSFIAKHLGPPGLSRLLQISILSLRKKIHFNKILKLQPSIIKVKLQKHLMMFIFLLYFCSENPPISGPSSKQTFLMLKYRLSLKTQIDLQSLNSEPNALPTLRIFVLLVETKTFYHVRWTGLVPIFSTGRVQFQNDRAFSWIIHSQFVLIPILSSPFRSCVTIHDHSLNQLPFVPST